jgi:hypothetical protein
MLPVVTETGELSSVEEDAASDEANDDCAGGKTLASSSR